MNIEGIDLRLLAIRTERMDPRFRGDDIGENR